MTSKELYEKLTPWRSYRYSGQYTSGRLEVNLSDIGSKLIKDAARCNGYNYDVYYDLRAINNAMENFNPKKEFTPMWIGFRKLGVDGTDYVLLRIAGELPHHALSCNYFALYSLNIESTGDDFYNVILNEYSV